MADLSITAANVQQASGADLVQGIAGEAITAGQSVYLNSSSKLMRAQHDGTAAEAAAKGIAVTSAPGADQPLVYQRAGNIDLGATLVVGESYAVGAGLGGIAPVSDLATADYVTHLGIATSASNLKMGINVSGTQRA
jgi:hypothetical protein